MIVKGRKGQGGDGNIDLDTDQSGCLLHPELSICLSNKTGWGGESESKWPVGILQKGNMRSPRPCF